MKLAYPGTQPLLDVVRTAFSSDNNIKQWSAEERERLNKALCEIFGPSKND